MITQAARQIDVGGGIVHRQEAFDADVAEHSRNAWGVVCSACHGWYSDVEGRPILYRNEHDARANALRLHNHFMHRDRVN